VLDAPFPVLFTARGVLLTFAVSWLIAYAVFTRIVPLNKTGWKRTDYLTLGLVVLGLIGAAGDARKMAAGNTMQLLDARRDSQYRGFRYFLKLFAEDGGSVCWKGVRSEFSPPDFESIEAARAIGCTWFKAAAAEFPEQVPEGSIDESTLRTPERAASELRWQFNVVAEEARRFNQLTAEKAAAERLSGVDEEELTLTFLSPFLLAVAVGVRVAKVEAEIRLDRLARMPPPPPPPPSPPRASAGEPGSEAAADSTRTPEESSNSQRA